MIGNSGPKLPSLRRELARSLTLVSSAWLAAVFVAVALGVHHEVNDLLDDGLQESAELIYGMLSAVAPQLPERTPGSSLPAPPHDERLVWQMVDAQGQVLLRSHKAPAEALLSDFVAGFSDAPTYWRVYAMRMPQPERFLYVAEHANDRFEARYEAIAVIGISAIVVGLLCAQWLRRRVNVALAPLRSLSAQVQRYDPMQADTHLPPPTRAEFVEVRQAILDLGERLSRRVEREQAFAAHAAHALRTPLAGMDAQLASALKEAPEAARPRLERTREAAQRLKRVVGSLLALFRSSEELHPQDIHLAELLARLPVDALAVQVEGEGRLHADPDLLAAALANLLDNALRYGARHCWVSVSRAGAQQTLLLRDDGPGVTAERRAQLQAGLGVDAAEGESGPVGLGLRLAALVARAHRGRLQLLVGTEGFAVALILWAGD